MKIEILFMKKYIYLHLCSLVLEPKLDLNWFNPKLKAEFFPLLLIWMWTLFIKPALVQSNHVNQLTFPRLKRNASIN